jgi:hypothetical protein
VTRESALLLKNWVPESYLDVHRRPSKLVRDIVARRQLGLESLEIVQGVPWLVYSGICDHHGRADSIGFFQFVDELANEFAIAVTTYITAYNPDELFSWTRDNLTLPEALEIFDSHIFIWNQAHLVKGALEGDTVQLDDETCLVESCFGKTFPVDSCG